MEKNYDKLFIIMKYAIEYYKQDPGEKMTKLSE